MKKAKVAHRIAAVVLALAAGRQAANGAAPALPVATLQQAPATLAAGQVFPIWAETDAGSKAPVKPTLSVYLPDPAKSQGTAVIVCPGGAFRGLAFADEGVTVAKSLNERGITALVLRYHLLTDIAAAAGPGGGRGRGGGMGALPRNLEIKNANANPEPDNKELAEVVKLATLDGVQSIKLARQNAAKWNINPKKIGILGFSAGGGVAVGSLLVGDAEGKPDFIATCYGPALVDVDVPADAPPLFIAVAADHQPVANGLMALYTVWKTAGKSAEMHIYSNGRAGFGMRKQGLPSDTWIERYYDWMKVQRFIEDVKPK